MKAFVESRLDPDEVSLFRRIRAAVMQLPDDINNGMLGKNNSRKKPVVLSCHILARAVAKVYGLQFRDGHFHNGCQHSWLITPSWDIIDVYPIAMLSDGPIMLDSTNLSSPWFSLYEADDSEETPDPRFSEPWFLEAVDRVAKLLRKIDRANNMPSP